MGAKADITLADFKGSTPLHLAVSQGCAASSRMLLQHSTTRSGTDALLAAADAEGNTALHLAAKVMEYGGQAAAVVISLLEHAKAVHINATNSLGFTPLIMASKKGNKAMVEILLRQPGIEVNSRDSAGRSALIAGIVSVGGAGMGRRIWTVK